VQVFVTKHSLMGKSGRPTMFWRAINNDCYS
jgi:hypothetical protein